MYTQHTTISYNVRLMVYKQRESEQEMAVSASRARQRERPPPLRVLSASARDRWGQH